MSYVTAASRRCASRRFRAFARAVSGDTAPWPRRLFTTFMPSSRAGMARGAASVTPGHSSTCAAGTLGDRSTGRVRTRSGTWGEKLTRFFGDGFVAA